MLDCSSKALGSNAFVHAVTWWCSHVAMPKEVLKPAMAALLFGLQAAGSMAEPRQVPTPDS